MELLQGDCLELMKSIPDCSVDMVLTDPPYGIKYQSNFRKDRFPKIPGDISPNFSFIDEVKRVLKPEGAFYCFSRWNTYPEWFNEIRKRFIVKNCIVWYKSGGGLGDIKRQYIPNHEFIIYAINEKHILRGKRRSDVFEFKKDCTKKYLHPTQKPVSVLSEIIIHSTDEGMKVLDPFMGSGSTGIACVNTNRDFIGIELDSGYFETAKQRIEESIKKEKQK